MSTTPDTATSLRFSVRLPGYLLLVCLTAILGSCSSTGGVSVADEQRAGAQAARQVEDQVGIYPGEFGANYVDTIGRRLVARLGETPYYFRFKVIDQGEPNAFATPGGYIFVSRGMLALINSEDELAGILAHEISHVTQRHHAEQANQAIFPAVLAIPGRAVGAVVGEDVGNMINAPISAAGEAYLSSYGRGQESEADEVGMQLAARAGYDPAALGTALTTVERTVTLLTGKTHKFSFFDSHPMTPDRVSGIEQLAATLQWTPARPVAKNLTALYKRVDGLTWGPNNPMQGIFREQQFMQPDMNMSITFPEDWRTVNTPRFVGAFAPNEEAVILFGGPDRPGDAQSLANEFVQELADAADIEPWEPISTQIGKWPAYVVKLDDSAGSEPVSVYYVWVNAFNTIFKIVAVGPNRYLDSMRATTESLRHLTEAELESIVTQRVRIATASGETFEQITARTGNILSPALTAAINGRLATQPVEAGALVKIVHEESYLGR